IEKKTYKWKSKIITDLVKKISLRVDGTTMSGYFFAVILLQVIVVVSFVVPAVQIGRLHMIDKDIFSPSFSPSTSTTFLSFRTIGWAVFGVFVYSFITLMDRVPRRDITPRYYINTAIRYIIAIALSSLFFLIFYQGSMLTNKATDGELSYGAIAAVAFTV